MFGQPPPVGPALRFDAQPLFVQILPQTLQFNLGMLQLQFAVFQPTLRSARIRDCCSIASARASSSPPGSAVALFEFDRVGRRAGSLAFGGELLLFELSLGLGLNHLLGRQALQSQ